MTTRDPHPDARSSGSAGIPGAGAAVRGVLSRLFGPPSFSPGGDPGDPGLTGPGSASWRVLAEPAAIAGGIRGLLVQLSHPLAMAGVHDHSAFRDDPLGRLQRTSDYVTTTTFGSTREALTLIRRVRAVHPRVRGTAPDGRAYRADDPRLLAWVSIALSSSFLAADQAWSPRPLDEAEADRFVAEQSRIGALLDPRVDVDGMLADQSAHAELRTGRIDLPMILEGGLHTTVAGLDAMLDDYGPELGINHQGSEALRFLRRPPIPLIARGGYQILLAGAIGSLDARTRAALEIRWPTVVARAAVTQADASLRLMRAAVGTSPSQDLAAQRANG